MNKKYFLIIIVIIIVLIGVAYFFFANKNNNSNNQNNTENTSINSTNTNANSNNSNSTSDNTNTEQNTVEPYTSQKISATKTKENNESKGKNDEQQLATFSTKIYTKDSARQNNLTITCSTLNDTIVKARRNFFFL